MGMPFPYTRDTSDCRSIEACSTIAAGRADSVTLWHVSSRRALIGIPRVPDSLAPDQRLDVVSPQPGGDSAAPESITQ